MWGVLLADSSGDVVYGPFSDEQIAAQFAGWLSVTVDPARVVPRDQLSAGVKWHDPLAQMLHWHASLEHAPAVITIPETVKVTEWVNWRAQGEQTSTDPTATAHLRAGERITLDELAVHLNAAAVWLRQLAVAAETPAVPVDLGKNLCDDLDYMARRLTDAGENVAELDGIITDGAPWGARALDETDGAQRPPVVVPTMRQVLGLARWHQETRALMELPPRPQRQRSSSPVAQDGIAYLDGIAGVPGLQDWESPRAAERRARERAAAIQAQARLEDCTTCNAGAGEDCRTRTGRVAETFHRPRLVAATETVDAQTGRAE